MQPRTWFAYAGWQELFLSSRAHEDNATVFDGRAQAAANVLCCFGLFAKLSCPKESCCCSRELLLGYSWIVELVLLKKWVFNLFPDPLQFRNWIPEFLPGSLGHGGWRLAAAALPVVYWMYLFQAEIRHLLKQCGFFYFKVDCCSGKLDCIWTLKSRQIGWKW